MLSCNQQVAKEENLTKAAALSFLNKSDYVNKTNEILDDQSKFKRLGPVFSNDNTASIESPLQKRLLDLVQGFLTGGTCTPWGYEAPKQGVRDEASE